MRTRYLRRRVLTTNTYDNFFTSGRQRNAFCVQPDVDTLSIKNFIYGNGYVIIFPSDQPWAHLQYRHFASEAAVHLSEFQANIASTDDDEMFRNEVHIHH